ncbi:hypothetical protein Acr_28g0005820 [Actinidia rufa]|uniref:Uncharacterized protein n=1 Tax=Actinidia rufa TaxID=165716 RepID=A0A7J0H9U3_9ERIC|nr:hypothetical protein Acr_28g0005820 [Actinidia rufa]
MANIKYNSETKKGKEKLCSWVQGKKLKATLDTFAEILEIPREDNPKFKFSNVGMPDLAVVSQELLLEVDEWDVSMNTARARLLWVIGMRKTIDLPRMMFLSLCAAHMASDKKGSVPFTGLFKRSGVHIPVDITRIEPEEVIDKEEEEIGGREMSAQIFEFKVEVNARITSLEEESRHHTTMLQEMKGMMIRTEAKYDNDEKDEED